MLQTFLATMAVMTLSMAALVWVRDRESALLQTINDRIPVMISVYEPNTKVLRLNQEFKRLTGWATAEARPVDLMAQSSPDPAYRAKIRAYMDTLPDGWHDVDMTTKDGRVIATSWTNVRLADDTRVGIGLDVRERKRVEGERERARVEAEAASRTKDEFFAMLGHELRNPLSVITTALHIVEVTGPLDERNEKARQIIVRQVAILVRLVDDLLDVTRLTTGKIVLSPSPVNLGAAAQRAVTAVATGAPGRHITCHALDESPSWARGPTRSCAWRTRGPAFRLICSHGSSSCSSRGTPAYTGPEPASASGSRSSSALSISTKGAST